MALNEREGVQKKLEEISKMRIYKKDELRKKMVNLSTYFYSHLLCTNEMSLFFCHVYLKHMLMN